MQVDSFPSIQNSVVLSKEIEKQSVELQNTTEENTKSIKLFFNKDFKKPCIFSR